MTIRASIYLIFMNGRNIFLNKYEDFWFGLTSGIIIWGSELKMHSILLVHAIFEALALATKLGVWYGALVLSSE